MTDMAVNRRQDSPITETPTVSVIIPAYNAAAHILDTLQSVFSQTFSNFEVIVVNDGSPDSGEFEVAIQPFSGRILYLKQENHGPSSARNLGISRARGQFLAFLDSDDTWFPDYLSEQMRLFEENASLDFVYSDALVCSLGRTLRKTYMEMCPSKSTGTFESLLVEDSQVITSGTVARKQAIIEAGLFDVRFRCCEDYDLWLRVAYRGGAIACHRKVLLRRYVRAGSLSSDNTTVLESIIKVLAKCECSMQLSIERGLLLREKLANTEARLALERGRRDLLVGEINRATASLSKANEFFKSVKLRMVIVGLKIAPHLTVLGVRSWQRALSLVNSRTHRVLA